MSHPAYARTETADSTATFMTANASHVPGFYPPTPAVEGASSAEPVLPLSEPGFFLKTHQTDASSDIYNAGLAEAENGDNNSEHTMAPSSVYTNDETQTTPRDVKESKEWLDVPKQAPRRSSTDAKAVPLLDGPGESLKKDYAAADTKFPALDNKKEVVGEKQEHREEIHRSTTDMLREANLPDPIPVAIPFPTNRKFQDNYQNGHAQPQNANFNKQPQFDSNQQRELAMVPRATVPVSVEAMNANERPFTNIIPLNSTSHSIRDNEIALVPRATLPVSADALEQMQHDNSSQGRRGILKNSMMETGNSSQGSDIASHRRGGSEQHYARQGVVAQPVAAHIMNRNTATNAKNNRSPSLAESRRASILNSFTGMPDPTQNYSAAQQYLAEGHQAEYIRPNQEMELADAGVERNRTLRSIVGAPIGMDDQRAVTPRPRSVREFDRGENVEYRHENIPAVVVHQESEPDRNSEGPIRARSVRSTRYATSSRPASRATSVRSRRSTIPEHPLFVPLPKNRRKFLPDNPLWARPTSSKSAKRWSWLPESPFRKTHRKYSSMPESRPGSRYAPSIRGDSMSRAESIRSRAYSTRSRQTRKSGLPDHPFSPSLGRAKSTKSVRSTRSVNSRPQSVINAPSRATSVRSNRTNPANATNSNSHVALADNQSHRQSTMSSYRPHSILKSPQSQQQGHYEGQGQYTEQARDVPVYRYLEAEDRPPMQRGESAYMPA